MKNRCDNVDLDVWPVATIESGVMGDSRDPVRILIVDDHEIVREGLKLIIEGWPGYFVVGEAANGEQAVEEAGVHQPDVVLMDVSMPIMDGIAATQKIKQEFQGIAVVMLTADRSVETVFAALASGAQGYCLKEVSASRLHAGVECVRLGDLWLDAEIAAAISEVIAREGYQLKPAHRRKKRTPTIDIDEDELTSREIEVLELIVKGLSNIEIADTIHISRDTVKTHVSNILRKLAASDRTQAAVKALRDGLIKENKDR